MMSISFWHEVARVFQSPCWWTLSFSWDDCDCHPCWSIAHSTGNIVVVNSSKWCSSCLILCSIHIVAPLNSRCVAEIVWIIRHAEVVGCTSLMWRVCSTSPSCIHKCGTWDTWTTTFPPSCVDHSSIPWSRRTCYSLVSPLSLRSTGTRHPISPISSISSSQHLNVGEGACVHTVLSTLSVSTPLGPVQSSSYSVQYCRNIGFKTQALSQIPQLVKVDYLHYTHVSTQHLDNHILQTILVEQTTFEEFPNWNTFQHTAFTLKQPFCACCEYQNTCNHHFCLLHSCYSCTSAVRHETTATYATVRMSVSNKCRHFIACWSYVM